MARLSDFQQKPATKIEQRTLDTLEKNARAAGFRGNWRATEIRVPKVRGGELHFHQDVFKDSDRVAQLCRAMDAGDARRSAMHIALDEALDEAEPEEDEDAEPEEVSEQKKMGGGCGRNYACDSGRLVSTKHRIRIPQKAADEFRRRGVSFSVF